MKRSTFEWAVRNMLTGPDSDRWEDLLAKAMQTPYDCTGFPVTNGGWYFRKSRKIVQVLPLPTLFIRDELLNPLLEKMFVLTGVIAGAVSKAEYDALYPDADSGTWQELYNQAERQIIRMFCSDWPDHDIAVQENESGLFLIDVTRLMVQIVEEYQYDLED